MAKILVSGLINYETTAAVGRFPVTYEPVRYPFFGVNGATSGVGYNLAKALHTLGDDVAFLSLVGADDVGELARAELAQLGIGTEGVLPQMAQTSRSVILYDADGKRAILVDLKDTQEQAYPPERFDAALADCEIAVLCNINFSRPLLKRAKAAGVPIATDVHAISDLESAYDGDFMAAADILFMVL